MEVTMYTEPGGGTSVAVSTDKTYDDDYDLGIEIDSSVRSVLPLKLIKDWERLCDAGKAPMPINPPKYVGAERR